MPNFNQRKIAPNAKRTIGVSAIVSTEKDLPPRDFWLDDPDDDDEPFVMLLDCSETQIDVPFNPEDE